MNSNNGECSHATDCQERECKPDQKPLAGMLGGALVHLAAGDASAQAQPTSAWIGKAVVPKLRTFTVQESARLRRARVRRRSIVSLMRAAA